MIKVRGNFDFVYKVPTFKKLPCSLKTGEEVVADFNNLEIDSPGNVWISVTEEKQKKQADGTKKNYTATYFVKMSQILQKGQKNEEYFVWVSDRIQQISLQRKRDLALEKKQRAKEKTEDVDVTDLKYFSTLNSQIKQIEIFQKNHR